MNLLLSVTHPSGRVLHVVNAMQAEYGDAYKAFALAPGHDAAIIYVGAENRWWCEIHFSEFFAQSSTFKDNAVMAQVSNWLDANN